MKYLIDKFSILYEEDVALARQRIAFICDSIGISLMQKSRFATTILEAIRNVINLFKSVDISFEYVEDQSKRILQSNLCATSLRETRLPDGLRYRIEGEIKKNKNLVEIINIKQDNPDSIGVTIGTCLQSGNSEIVKKILNLRKELKKKEPSSSYEVIREHNEELLQLLEELSKKDELLAQQVKKLEEMNKELDRTNRGIMALTHELEDKNKQLEIKNKDLLKEIREREKAEKKLKESEERYRVLVENITDGITLVRNGIIIFVNPQTSNLLGYTHEELLGSTVVQYFDPLIREKLLNIISSKEKGCSERACETKAITKSGVEVDIELVVRNISFADTDTRASLFIIRDIRLRKLLEAERIYSGKLQSIGVLAGGIAHDFNNLLTVIIGNITLAKMKTDKKNDIYNFLNEAENASLKAKELTHRFLEFTSWQMPKVKKKENVKSIIIESVNLIFDGDGVEKEVLIKEDLWQVECDLNQLKRALTSIFINAKEAMVNGGKLSVRAENIFLDANEIPSLPQGEYIKITITDTGCGIPEENLDRIFDPYFSTKERATIKGMGLGLTIAYSIIKAHGGTILVRSKINEYTTFEIFLPAIPE